MNATTKMDVNALLEMVKNLPKAQRDSFVDQIMTMLATPQEAKKTGGCQEIISEVVSGMPDCPHCGASASLGNVKKNGWKNGSQRYCCKACHRRFFLTTNTVFSGTRKSADTWRKFIELTISGASLNKCKDECGIAYQTAFNWRHKVLNAFEVNQKSTQMAGVVEIDEMLIPLSYKGNHVQGSFGARKLHAAAENDMPRKSFRRGSDNKSMSSKDKACVFCMVEDGNKAFYAAVPGVGFMNNDMLRCTVGKHIKKESALMLADNYKVTHRFLEDNGYQHRILSSNTSDNPHDHKPEIVDGLHMQHVNSMHHHIRRFLSGYCGVSSKYLGNYIALFVWLRYVDGRKQKKRINAVSLARASAADCYVTRKQIHDRPAVPMCA